MTATVQTAKSFDELWNLLGDSLPMPDEQGEADDANGQPLSTVSADCPPGPDYQDRLSRIRQFAAWKGENGEIRLRAAREFFLEQYPEHAGEADRMTQEGRKDAELVDRAYSIGTNGGSRDNVHRLISECDPPLPDCVIDGIWKRYSNAVAAKRKRAKERERKKSGEQMSTVKSRPFTAQATTGPDEALAPASHTMPTPINKLHPNDLRTQQARDAWELIIDESGEAFGEDVSLHMKHRTIGRMVGLLVPADCAPLPHIKRGWHAVNCQDPYEIDQVLQSILDAPVGVLGLEVLALPVTAGERWMDTAALLIDWALRLMPVDAPCKLAVRIEQRGVFNADQPWDVLRRDCMRRLALAFPTRAARISLDVGAVTKTGHKLNGYADALAFTWAKTSESSKVRLRLSGLEGTCLLTSRTGIDSRTMLNALDAFAQGVNLPADLWWNMVSAPDARTPAALLFSLLTLVGQEAQRDRNLWSNFLNQVRVRMRSSPVDLAKLAAAVDWLQNHQPEGAVMLPVLRLVWLTVNLARKNHEGRNTDDPEITGWIRELKELGDLLYDEAAPLVCHADLHRAVAATNRYEFDSATAALDRWKDRPPAEPGLRYWAQVRSSLGQHAAFRGDNTTAIALFQEAIAAFRRLSDPEQQQADLAQTGCYLAIAMMDNPDSPTDAARGVVEQVIGPLPDAAARLACSADPSERYAHHLLLRWLAHKGDVAISRLYLQNQDHWQTGSGHPWPLIELYRACLLNNSDTQAALDRARNAAALANAPEQGPIVRLIGACCRTVAATWGLPWPEADTELNALAKELPAASSQITHLRAAQTTPGQYLEVIMAALPFNYR